MTLVRNKKFFLIIATFMIYLFSLQFFKVKYISIYHSDPLSFHLSCEIQKYRYKAYIEGINGSLPEQTKHFVEHALKPLLGNITEESICDSINIISYDELRSAILDYHKKFLSEAITKEKFEEQIISKGSLSRFVGSPNIFIWDDDFWYFSIVTATTTGYGDIIPRSEKARSWVSFQILFSTFIAGLIFAIMGIKFDKK
jgi:hypothetical protein